MHQPAPSAPRAPRRPRLAPLALLLLLTAPQLARGSPGRAAGAPISAPSGARALYCRQCSAQCGAEMDDDAQAPTMAPDEVDSDYHHQPDQDAHWATIPTATQSAASASSRAVAKTNGLAAGQSEARCACRCASRLDPEGRRLTCTNVGLAEASGAPARALAAARATAAPR